MYHLPLVVGTAVIALAPALALSVGAQTITQTTIVRAPIAAIAFGPSYASVDVNVNRGGNHTVVVKKPLVAVSTPLFSMHIRVN